MIIMIIMIKHLLGGRALGHLGRAPLLGEYTLSMYYN